MTNKDLGLREHVNSPPPKGGGEFTQDFYDSICRSIRGEDNYTDVYREEDV